MHRSDRISNVGSPRKTCPNQFVALLNTYHSNAMGICVFVQKSIFFAISFPKLSPNCRLCNSLVLMSFYQGITPAQVPKTQELGRFAASFRRLRSEKSSASGGPRPLAPHQGLSLDGGPRWGLCPQTPIIGSHASSPWLVPSNENFCVCPCLSHSCAVLKRLNGSSCAFV